MRILSLTCALGLVLTLTLAAGCYSPDKAKCAFRCAASEPSCPSGYACGTDQYCHQKGHESEMCDFPAVVDAGVDAAPGTPAIMVTPGTLNVTEGGAPVTFAVVLSSQPAGDVTVTLTSSDATAAMVTPASVTFTSASFGLPQTITVTPVADSDLVNETVTVTAAGTGATSATVMVNVTDDDMQAVTTSPTTMLTVTEGMTGTLGVRLAFAPAADVTLTVAALDTGTATVSPGTLTFTPANFASVQDVTVSGVDDVDLTDDSTMVTLTGGGLTKMVMVTVTDNDTQNISVSPSSVAVTEEGATVMFGVSLTQMPGADVTVAVASSDATSVTVNAPSLTFTSANYMTPQMVTLTAIADNDLVGESVTINLTSAPLTAKMVTVTVTDNDTQGLTLTNTPLTLTEGMSGNVTVRLAFEPTAAMTMVSISSGDNSAVTTTQTMLTFTPADYATPQTVQVNAIEDADAAPETVTVTLSSGALAAPVTFMVTTVENDTQNLMVAPISLTVTEAAGAMHTGTFTVELAAAPTSDVTVTPGTLAPAGKVMVTPASYTLTSSNYNTPQTFTVTALDDVDGTHASVTIPVVATGGHTQTVNVTATASDDDLVTPSVTTLNVTQAMSTSFMVHLSDDPGAGGLVVTPASSNLTAVTTSPATLTFTGGGGGNFATPQMVTVNGLAGQDGMTSMVQLSAPGQATKTVMVTVDP